MSFGEERDATSYRMAKSRCADPFCNQNLFCNHGCRSWIPEACFSVDCAKEIDGLLTDRGLAFMDAKYNGAINPTSEEYLELEEEPALINDRDKLMILINL